MPEVDGRLPVKRHEFYAALSEEMLTYVTRGENVGVQVDLPHDE